MVLIINFVLGIVGETEDGQDGKEYYLWTHRRLDIGWNGNQVRNSPLEPLHRIQKVLCTLGKFPNYTTVV